MVIHKQYCYLSHVLAVYPQCCEYSFLNKRRTKNLKEHVDRVWINWEQRTLTVLSLWFWTLSIQSFRFILTFHQLLLTWNIFCQHPFGEKKFRWYIKNEAKEGEIKKTNFTNIKLNSWNILINSCLPRSFYYTLLFLLPTKACGFPYC